MHAAAQGQNLCVARLETSRTPDRDAVLKLLRERDIAAEPGDDELSIEVRDRDGVDLLSELETLVRESELPLVPVHADGLIYLRPQGD